MTQALVFNKSNRKDLHGFDVYYHPGDKDAKQENCKYKYEVRILKFSLEDFNDFIEHDFEEIGEENILYIKSLFAMSKRGYIWKISSLDSDLALDYLDEFYVTLKGARDYALEYCVHV